MHWNSTLTRKTPLKRKPLTALHPAKRQQLLEARTKPRKPLKKISKSQRKKLRSYKDVAREFLSLPENEFCLVCVRRREAGENITLNYSSEIHHQRGRISHLLTDTRFFIPSCYRCRSWPHDNPREARAMKLLAPASEWNVVPRD